MARYLGEWVKDPKPELVFNAAEFWRDRCLLDDKSVFTDKQLWTRENFEKLQNYYIRKLIEGEEGEFLDRLKVRLKQAPLEVKQLTAEIFWMMLLMPSTIPVPRTMGINVELSQKRKHIETIWSWSGESFPQNTLDERGLINCLKQGIAPFGYLFHYYWQGFYYMIIWTRYWKSKSPQEQQELMADYQRFGQDLQDWEDTHRKEALENARKLLGKGINIKNTAVRHVIVYLLFPDHFEKLVNVDYKKEIIAFFNEEGNTSSRSNLEDDKLLCKIRQDEEKRHLNAGKNKKFDFFDIKYQEKWNWRWVPGTEKKWNNA